MPLDGTNYTETKPSIWSLDGLIAWLETQEPERQYCYVDGHSCLAYQYLTALGLPALRVGGGNWYYTADGGRRFFPEALHRIAKGYPRTFGAALSRARARALRDSGEV